MSSPVAYIRESLSELRKVTWPTRRTVISHTVLVIVVSVLLMVILTGYDLLLSNGFRALISFVNP